MSAAPDDSFAGMRATYAEDAASFGDESVRQPDYMEKVLADAAFVSEYRTRPADLGIEGGTVRIVEVSGWTNPGGMFIVKDGNALIFLWDGNFYEMKREAQM